MTAQGPLSQNSSRGPCWIWPVRLPPRMASGAFQAAHALGEWLRPWYRSLAAGLLIGALPLLLDYATGAATCRILTALMLTPLLLGAVARDSPGQGLALVGSVFGMHSALVLVLAAHDPVWLGQILPGGVDYWERSRSWITTGVSREYELAWWVPSHLLIFAGVNLFGYLSLGWLVFWEGLYQVDLMNYYVAQLIVHSPNPGWALLVGWHPWSLCRGIGCFLVVFEVASLSFQRLTGVPLSPPGRRCRRWLAGFAFFLLDGVVKYALLEVVRQVLANNLAGDVAGG